MVTALTPGPTLFLMPATLLQKRTRRLAEKMEDHLDLIRLDPTYRLHFHDGTSLDLTPDMQRMRDALRQLNPGRSGTSYASWPKAHVTTRSH